MGPISEWDFIILGLVAAAVYSLVLVQRAFHGALPAEPPAARDFGPRELAYAAAMIVALVVLGVRPQPAIDTAAPAIAGLLERTSLPAPVASLVPPQ